MNCREFEIAAQTLLEGEPHPEAHTHAAACEHCRSLLEDLNNIHEAGARLGNDEAALGRDLWARIEAAALEEELWVRPMRWRWLGLGEMLVPARTAFAGALALLLVLAAGVVAYPPLQLPMAELDPPDPVGVAQGELMQEASFATRYTTHLDQAEQQVLDQPTSAEAQQTIHELVAGPMRTVDRAIEQTQSQLESYPDDTLAREELRRLYQQKAVVLAVMSEASWDEDAR